MTISPVVLIVDDDPDTSEMYSVGLSQEGFRTVAASTATDALRRSLEEPPDVIVTDLMLFGTMEGVALTRRVREHAKTQNVGVIVLTGHVRSTDRDEATRAGCDVFLTKPCMPDELALHVRRLISARRTAGGGAS